MGELFALTNLIVDFMKHLSWHGISVWFVIQVMITISVVVWPVILFLFRMFGGGGDD